METHLFLKVIPYIFTKEIKLMAIHHNLADKLAKKGLALDAFTTPTPNNTGENSSSNPY